MVLSSEYAQAKAADLLRREEKRRKRAAKQKPHTFLSEKILREPY
jgi:hypothetical protein